MLRRRLNQKDVEERLKEIRSAYSAFSSKYNKNRNLVASFDERYFEALRTRMDLDRFFQAEKEALKSMEDHELADLRKMQNQKTEERLNQRQKKDTAQRVWEEHQRRIEKYPSYGLHPEASAELDKLIGAMAAYEEEHWSRMERTFRAFSPGRAMDTRVALEMRWREFCVPGTDGAPPRMGKYRNLLSRFPRDQKAVEWEERQILYDAARFMGLLRNTMGEFLNDKKVPAAERKHIEQGQEVLEEILIDFRLTDLIRLS